MTDKSTDLEAILFFYSAAVRRQAPLQTRGLVVAPGTMDMGERTVVLIFLNFLFMKLLQKMN